MRAVVVVAAAVVVVAAEQCTRRSPERGVIKAKPLAGNALLKYNPRFGEALDSPRTVRGTLQGSPGTEDTPKDV